MFCKSVTVLCLQVLSSLPPVSRSVAGSIIHHIRRSVLLLVGVSVSRWYGRILTDMCRLTESAFRLLGEVRLLQVSFGCV